MKVASVKQLSLIFVFLFIHGVAASSSSQRRPVNPDEVSPAFWEGLARERFYRSLRLLAPSPAVLKRAKNVILFLGDGMGLPSIAAGRFFKTEVKNRIGDANPTLEFEGWPFGTMCRTYDLETLVTDSASSATAYLCGTKTRTGMLGLTGAVDVQTCGNFSAAEKVDSVLKAALRSGRAAGIVTTSRITHASPAGAYANVAYRNWESDDKIQEDCANETHPPADIARQLVDDNSGINVVLGGGQSHFYPNSVRLPSDARSTGLRLDGRNLIDDWLQKQKDEGRRAAVLKTPTDIFSVDVDNLDYLLGPIYASHMPYSTDIPAGHPTLANLTVAALKILTRQPKGFFLFVEGARIDHAHHVNKAKKALSDLLAFEEAIHESLRLVNLHETLIIVTADHSHSFSLVAEPSRFSSILDRDFTYGNFTEDERGLLPLAYANGPGAAVNDIRRNISVISRSDLHGNEFQQPALAPISWSSHGGEDVGIYAAGPFSWLFHSTIDNTFVAHSMKYALCVEPYTMERHCLLGNGVTSYIWTSIIPVVTLTLFISA